MAKKKTKPKKKEPLDLAQRYIRIRRYLEGLDAESISAYKSITIFLVVVDMFGVYWWLGAKKLGIALILMLIGVLTIFLLLERRLPEKMTDNKPEEEKEEEAAEDKKEEKKEDKKEEAEKKSEGPLAALGSLGDSLGLGSAEEYEKRVNASLAPGF